MIKKEKWEIALQKFINNWKNKKEVVGAIVCGSYITGNPSKHSDIDIHIILDSKTSWRERGNEIINGILIEYFANPIRQHYRYMEEDYQSRKRINAHMFCSGKILFDKTGELAQLVKDSKKYLIKGYVKQSKVQIELAKYHIWDMKDNLEEVFESSSNDFCFVFFNALNELFETYGKFLKFDFVPVHKIKRFLINKSDQKKYCIKNFPDHKFVGMFVSAMAETNKIKMIKKYQKLTTRVLNQMGGFNINGWKIKTQVK